MTNDDLKKVVLEATYQSAQSALRTVLGINAAALAAILGFRGAGKIDDLVPYHGSLKCFVGGVTAGAVAFILFYAANYSFFRSIFYKEQLWTLLEPWFGTAAFILSIVSVGAFVAGMLLVFSR